jgi:hypothetical protein
MRALIAFIALLALPACTTVADYHNACLEQNTYIAAQVACVKQNVAADDYMRNDTLVQEYIKTGDVLVERVAHKELTERQAQLQLVEKLNQMRQQQLREQAALAEIDRANRDRFPRETRCHQNGAHIYCTEY